MNKFLLIFVLVLGGCTTTQEISNLQTSISISGTELNESTGILVGTYTKNVGEKEYGIRELRFTDTKDYKSNYSIDRKRFSTFLGYEYPVKDNGKEGDVFAFVLPAGEYTLYNFTLESGSDYKETWSSQQPFSIPFVVHPNKVNYIGEINFTAFTRDRKSIIGIKTKERRAGYWAISDQLDRDKSYIAEKFKNLPLADIESVIPQSKKNFTPFVVLPSEATEFEEVLRKMTSSENPNNELFGKPINAIWMTCNKPYVLKQDCSIWNGAKKKVVIDDFKMKVAGSSDGKTVLVMESESAINPFSFSLKKTKSVGFEELLTNREPINNSYYAIKERFDEKGITVNKVRTLKPVAGISGYVLLLDKDGYTLLDEYAENKNKQK